MVVDFVPVVVEGDLLPRTLQLRAPVNMTVAQFLHGIRKRMNLTRVQACHLASKKGSTIVMSQKMSHVYRENKSKNGWLHFTCATESAFGCPVPPHSPLPHPFKVEEAPTLSPPPSPVLDLWEQYQQWLAEQQQQQDTMIQLANDYIAAHHDPNSVGAVYHVHHSPEGGIVLYQAEGGGDFQPVELVDPLAPWS